jgi:beta-D-xylosidase 4
LLDEPVQAQIKLVLKGSMTVLDKWPQPPPRRG